MNLTNFGQEFLMGMKYFYMIAYNIIPVHFIQSIIAYELGP